MQKNMKQATLGFTLIELLAVIVILAIIALIATPIILGVIQDSKKKAAESAVYGYIDAVHQLIIKKEMDEDPSNDVADGTYTCPELDAKGILVQGDKPSKCNLTIDQSQVKKGTITIGGYDFVIENGKIKGDGSSGGGDSVLEGTKFIESVLATFPQLELNADKTGCKITADSNYTYMNGCYLKGNAYLDNYVWYNGFLWKVIGINPDSSIKMITVENISVISYHNTSSAFETSYAYDWLNTYFTSNFDSKDMVNGTWCNPTATANSVTVNTTCVGTTFNAKVGLLSLDEYNLSRTAFNSQYWWLLTSKDATNEWYALDYGDVGNAKASDGNGIRPVINVRSDLVVTAGDYTLASYAVLNQKANEEKQGKLTDVVKTGEYVTLNGKNYRAVSKDTTGVKLILDSYMETATYSTIFNTITPDSYATTLVGSANLSKLVKETWYKGDAFVNGTDYKTVLNYTTNPYTSYVGMIRMGEMMSGQSASILTKNYTVASSYDNAVTYWTNSNSGSAGAWRIGANGRIAVNTLDTENAIRPMIKIAPNTNITGGNGTLGNPYKL